MFPQRLDVRASQSRDRERHFPAVSRDGERHFPVVSRDRERHFPVVSRGPEVFRMTVGTAGPEAAVHLELEGTPTNRVCSHTKLTEMKGFIRSRTESTDSYNIRKTWPNREDGIRTGAAN